MMSSDPPYLSQRCENSMVTPVGVRRKIAADFRRYAAVKWPNRQADLLRWPSLLTLLITARGLRLLLFHRLCYWVSQHSRHNRTMATRLLGLLCLIAEQFMVISTKAALDWGTPIGPGTYLSNGGHIIIKADRIGAGCAIQRDVTIGVDNTSPERETPNIGANVWIGANSVIFGGISIGNGATVLEGSVISTSVPADCVVGRNPARVVRRDFDNQRLLAQPEVSSGSHIQV